jgi:hypothetical protein
MSGARGTDPFHPQSGELVIVVGVKRHAGVEHLVIRQPDRTLALLPTWMTKPQAKEARLVEYPRHCLQRLSDLRALVDALLTSWRGESSPRHGADHEMRAIPPERSVRAAGNDTDIAPFAASKTDVTTPDVADGGRRDRTRGIRRPGGRR